MLLCIQMYYFTLLYLLFIWKSLHSKRDSYSVSLSMWQWRSMSACLLHCQEEGKRSIVLYIFRTKCIINQAIPYSFNSVQWHHCGLLLFIYWLKCWSFYPHYQNKLELPCITVTSNRVCLARVTFTFWYQSLPLYHQIELQYGMMNKAAIAFNNINWIWN